MHVAAFITSHGFGHAGRASAVLDALSARVPGLRADLFTTVPDAFLRSSLRAPYRRIPFRSDPGMVQRGAFDADLEATTDAVATWVEGLPAAAAEAGARLRAAGTELVLCDIDAAGILAAADAGIPSVLVENFRWDWIYGGLREASPRLRALGARLGEVYGRASVHVQVAPACDRWRGAVQVEVPVARAARRTRDEVREELGVDSADSVVLVTTGGVRDAPLPIDALRERPELTFLVTGADRSERTGNVLAFGHDEPLYLPDLIRASDCVVAKLGYSTVAETWREGKPLLGIPRRLWPEGPVLSRWTAENVPGFELGEADFRSGSWTGRLDELLALPAAPTHPRAGQDEIAERILERVG